MPVYVSLKKMCVLMQEGGSCGVDPIPEAQVARGCRVPEAAEA